MVAVTVDGFLIITAWRQKMNSETTAQELVEDEFARRSRLRWLKSKDKKLLNDAFRRLRKHGYFSRQNFTFCMSDGVAEVPAEYADRYVFYHVQDTINLELNGCIPEDGMHVAWAGDGDEIAGIISKTGLKAYWNGDKSTRILILPSRTTPKQFVRITSECRTLEERRRINGYYGHPTIDKQAYLQPACV